MVVCRVLLRLLLAAAFARALVAPPRGLWRRSLVAAGSTRLEEAFRGLSEDQKYEALLLGAVAPGGTEAPDIDGALALVDEMAEKDVGSVGPRVLSALVDAAATRRDARVVSKVLRLSARSGAARLYASEGAALRLPPSDAALRRKALQGAPEVPADDRAAEVAAAVAAAAAVGVPAASVLVGGFLGYDEFGPSLVLLLAAALAALDATMNGGGVAAKVGDGADRLLSRDARRDAECEAASFATAYLLGLPCFPFRASALEAADQIARDDDVDEAQLQKLLVWLVSGVAAERRKHRKLLASDPRQATAFLALLRSRGLKVPGDGDTADDATNGRAPTDADRVRWALKEATDLQGRRIPALEGLADFFESGAATAGDVVMRIEAA